jgi:hypothetical protein
VDTVDWPNDMAGAMTVFAALPATVAGKKKHARGTYARYGRGEKTRVQVWPVPSGSDAAMMVAEWASLSLCDPSTRAGTAPVPGLATAAEGNDVWFACEGRDDVKDAAPEMLGVSTLIWSSGSVVWQVSAPDTQTLTSLTSPLVAAAAKLPGDGPGTGTTTSATAGTAPYGIENAAWPQTMKTAGPLFARLPAIDNKMLNVLPAQKGMDASMMLAFMFGMNYGCARGSFAGTAVAIEGSHPVRPPAGSKVRWFTCQVNGAEGDPGFRGYAVGWASGDIAWLVVGASRPRVEALVHTIVAAASK